MLSSPAFRGTSEKDLLGFAASELNSGMLAPRLCSGEFDWARLDGPADGRVQTYGPVGDAQLDAAAVLPKLQQHDLIAALAHERVAAETFLERVAREEVGRRVGV